MESQEVNSCLDVYEKPKLEVIDLAGEDVFNTGCNTTATSGAVLGNCTINPCLTP
jgi:hypothetical protein